ncbi:MAG: FecR family protein, partial [Thermoanaerobaculia bacterium]
PSQWKDLLKYNAWIKDPNSLEPGKEIKIPYDLLKKTLLEAKVQKVYGDVMVKSQDGWQKAVENQTLKQNDFIKTGKNSQAVLEVPRNNNLLIEPETEIALSKLIESPFEKSTKTTVEIIRGKIKAVVGKIFGKSEFSVKTPSGVSLIRGTEFKTRAGEEETYLEVYEGKVVEENEFGSVLVPENFGTKVEKGKEPLKPRQLPTPPIPNPEETEVVIASKEGAYLSWQEVKNAVEYRVQISKDKEFFNLVEEKSTRDNFIVISNYSEGIYYWRVISKDDVGLESKPGEIRTLLFPEID